MSTNHTDFVDAVFTACGNGGEVTRAMRRLAANRADIEQITVSYVSPWRQRGVPSHWRLIFTAVALERGLEPPVGFLPAGVTLDYVRSALIGPGAAVDSVAAAS